MLDYILNLLRSYATKRGNKFLIKDRVKGNEGEVYLIRYILFKCKWFGLYLHEFVKSDDEVHHNHPWAFSTVILKGEYIEEISEIVSNKFPLFRLKRSARLVKAGQFVHRKASHIHRILLTHEDSPKPITLSIMWHKTQEWGFFVPTEKLGIYKFVHWKQFLGLNENQPNKTTSME